MPIEPAIQKFFDELPPDPDDPTKGVAQRRSDIEASYNELMARFPTGVGLDLASIIETRAEVPFRHRTVPVRILSPEASEPLTVFIYLFGGGWWQRTFDSPDVVGSCRQTALEANAIVIMIDYSLAPEHPYPTALEEAYAVLEWVAAGRSGLNVRADRIAVGGWSAGGNLAAALCLLARDRGGPAIALQVLETPCLDATMERFDAPVVEAFAGPGSAETEPIGVREAYDLYLSGGGQLTDLYVSPLHAPSLEGLPPAVILTAEFDALWAEGRAYGDALRAAGVPVVSTTYAGQLHLAGSLSAISLSSRVWRSQVSAAVAALARE
jgi:acetyl esterase